MPILTEATHAGEHVVSEANGSRSREAIIVAASQTLKAGHVVGKITSSGQIAALLDTDDPSLEDGSETAYGVLFAPVTTASGETAKGVIHTRDCELRSDQLVWPDDIASGDKDTAIAALATRGIILR
jgi:hypothetical protein